MMDKIDKTVLAIVILLAVALAIIIGTLVLYEIAPTQIIIDCEDQTIKTIQDVKFFGESITVEYEPNLECE